MWVRTTVPRGAVKRTRAPRFNDHGTRKSASLHAARASRASRTFLSNPASSVSVVSKLYPGALARSRSVSRRVFVIHPGIHETSWARCPSANDLGCGFQRPLSLGTRSSNLRVVAIRSEEHTSELQSLRHLVCRLL